MILVTEFMDEVAVATLSAAIRRPMQRIWPTTSQRYQH